MMYGRYGGRIPSLYDYFQKKKDLAIWQRYSIGDYGHVQIIMSIQHLLPRIYKTMQIQSKPLHHAKPVRPEYLLRL